MKRTWEDFRAVPRLVWKTATSTEDRDTRKRPKGGTIVSEEERKDLEQEGQDEKEDVEAHRRHGGKMTDDGGDDDADDVEAHRRHGGK